MFSKRHYEWLADWAKNSAMGVTSLDRERVTRSLCDCLEKQAAAAATNFNRAKFLKACGLGD